MWLLIKTLGIYTPQVCFTYTLQAYACKLRKIRLSAQRLWRWRKANKILARSGEEKNGVGLASMRERNLYVKIRIGRQYHNFGNYLPALGNERYKEGIADVSTEVCPNESHRFAGPSFRLRAGDAAYRTGFD